MDLIVVLDKTFGKNKINPKNKNFDKKIYEEYKNLLLSIPETQTNKLAPDQAYQRMRFISAVEQPALLLKLGYIPMDRRIKKTPQNASNRVKRGYKDWHRD